MDSFFLYLPMHYAEARGWFGLVPHTDVALLTLDRTTTPSDDTTYLQLLPKLSKDTPRADLVLCDPLCVFDAPERGGRSACVLAALVTNTAFWAVNHGSHPVRTFTDLGLFSNVIAFPKGSTSHRIASAIGDASGTTPRIHTVNPGRELMRLVKSAHGTLALTPDALGIAALRETHPGFRVELDISKTKEFVNHIVTVLVTRSDVLETSRDAIEGIVKSLQVSMDLCRKADSDVIAYAAKLHAKPSDQVAEALELAIEAQLYPESVAISRGQWLTAVGAKDSPLSKRMTPETELLANEIYNVNVAPYLHFAQNVGVVAASAEERLTHFDQTHRRSSSTTSLRTAILLAATGSVAFLASQLSTVVKARYVQAVSAGLLTLGLGLLLLRYYRSEADRKLHRSLIPLFTGAACVVALWYAQILSNAFAAQAVTQLVSFVLAAVLSARLWSRHDT